MKNKPTVYILYQNFDNAKQVYEKALDNIFVYKKRIENICIKINLCDYRAAESGATTDPYLLSCLIEILIKKFNPLKIRVLENDATSVEAESLFTLLGFRPIAGKYGVELINASKDKWIKKSIPDGKIFKEIEAPAAWECADLKINFPKLKVNILTKTTGCLKNLFGLVREKKKSVFHNKISKVICDVNLAMKSDLCLVDGIIGQSGGGPAFGRPKICNLLIAGTDPVSVDACCARLMGFNPYFVSHIREAWLRGIGSINYKLITDIPNLSYHKYHFKFSMTDYLLRSLARRVTNLGPAG